MDNSKLAGDIVELARAGSIDVAVRSVAEILDQMNSLFTAEHNAIVSGNPVPKNKFLSDHKVFLIKLCQDFGGKKMGGQYEVKVVYDPKTNALTIEGR